MAAKVGAVAEPVFWTHWVNGFRAPQVFWRSKTKPLPWSALVPLSVRMAVRPPAERMASASTLPAAAVTSRMAASLTPRPRPPLQERFVGLDWPPSESTGLEACEAAPAAVPKARRVLVPSTVISAGSCEARKDACDEPVPEPAAGVSSRKSCQRRPLAGRAWSSVAVTVVFTAAATESEDCVADAPGAAGDGLSNAASSPAAGSAPAKEGAAAGLSGNGRMGARVSASCVGADWG